MMEGRKEEEDHPERQVPGAHFTEVQTEASQGTALPPAHPPAGGASPPRA